jgi:hypothetical protein|nr:MAG TPA: hypothetical protein [Caudoviricetes sp.]
MILDSGVLSVYRVDYHEGKGPKQTKPTLTLRMTVQYGERVVGITRYYEAAKVGRQIDRTVRIWRQHSITIRDVCQLDSQWYLIRKVTPTSDEDGLLVTDLDLEQSDDNVWEGATGENQS